MKKLKYLLFIIPLFFIFVGNSKAFDIYTCGDTSITEQTILTDLQNYFPNDDFTGYDYLSCSLNPNGYYNYRIYCSLFTVDFINNLSLSSTSSNYYSFRSTVQVEIPGGFTSLKYYQIAYNKNTCTKEPGLTTNNQTTLSLNYFFPLSSTSSFLYTNFNSNVINSNVGNNLYNYNVLSLVAEEPDPEEPTIENKIYLPDELEEGNCPILLNQNVIRVYEEEPQVNTPVNYTDYYINSHYLTQTGTETLSNTVSCMDLEDFTTSYVYRFDFHQIILIFLAIVVIVGYPLMKIIHSFFIGFKRR